MFSAPTKNKTALFAMFSLPRAPKSSQNIGIYDVFATTKKASVAKTLLFATLWQHNMSEMLYFTMFLESKTLVFTEFCENTCTKHRKYPQIQRLHFPWQEAKTSKNTGNYNVSEQRIFYKRVIFRQLSASNASQKQEGGYPPPLQILHFKMLQDVCNKQLLTPKTSPEPHFLTVFTMFYVRTPIATSKKNKKSLKHKFPPGV